jgi:hypothetical protein
MAFFRFFTNEGIQKYHQSFAHLLIGVKYRFKRAEGEINGFTQT